MWPQVGDKCFHTFAGEVEECVVVYVGEMLIGVRDSVGYFAEYRIRMVIDNKCRHFAYFHDEFSKTGELALSQKISALKKEVRRIKDDFEKRMRALMALEAVASPCGGGANEPTTGCSAKNPARSNPNSPHTRRHMGTRNGERR